ncbi:MAG: metallophosphoesterase [Phycisphaerae bacterium]
MRTRCTGHRPFARTRTGCGAVVTWVLACIGCGAIPGRLLPDESTDPVDADRFELVARLAHISDAHVVDEESPGRLTVAATFAKPAWRPYEAYSIQLLDGIIRTVNKLHVARHTIDFVIHTGDATDNAQLNELDWFITVFDGGRIDPQSGPDDRDPASLPDPLLDPYHPFDAQGLYQSGVHGDAPTIEWYSLLGNHDRFAVGVFPIVTDWLGHRVSPLPLQDRFALSFPVVLDPVGCLSWAPITPANPGPPPEINFPQRVQANPARRYITNSDFIKAHLTSISEPPGHGFDAIHPRRTWYSVLLVPGLRLIALNSASPLIEQPTLAYAEGAISLPQVPFLRRELEKAQAGGECVIVATHHPSDALEPVYGTALAPKTFRNLLNDYPCVKLHLAGHWHENIVIDRGGYVEMVTASTLDAPQQGRIIEIWRSEPRALARADSQIPTEPPAPARGHSVSPDSCPPRTDPRALARADNPTSDREIEIRYWTFSHLDEIDPPDDSHADLFNDPLLPMRRAAAELAGVPTPEPRVHPR